MKIKKNVTKDSWTKLLFNSYQNNIFSNFNYLNIIKSNSIEYDNYILFDNHEPLMGLIQFNNFDNIPIFYNSIILSKKIDSKDGKNKIDLIEFFLNELVKDKSRLFIRTHPSIRDIRAFQWFNYSKEKNKFNITPYYTSRLKIDNLSDVKLNFNRSRKEELKKANKKLLTTKIEEDFTILDYLNKKTFNRERTIGEIFFSTKLAQESIEKNFGTLAITRENNGDPIAASLFIHDDDNSYYMVGGSLPEFRSLGSATHNIFFQIQNSHKMKKKTIDFVGCNSPGRGYFKTSFGGDLNIYFDIKLNC